MMSRSLLICTATAGLVAAQSRNYQSIIAAGSPYGSASSAGASNGGPSNSSSPDDRELFAQANQSPNVTTSFDFNPFNLDGVFNTGSNAVDSQNTWTLRINVTDFAVPDAEPMYPSEQPDYADPHITNTVMELDWHENESFRSALNGSTAPFCVAVTTGNFLPNVTNQFTSDNEDGDCVPVLGEECTNAILSSRGSGSGASGCSFDGWTDLPECAATLGASRSYDQYGLSRISWDMNSNSSARNVSSDDAGYGAVANGTDGRFGFLSITSEVYNATNTTLYDDAATKMHVIVTSIPPTQGQFGLVSNRAMCVRADARQLEVQQGGGEGGDGSNGGDGSSDESGDGEGGDGNFATTLVPGAGAIGPTLALAGAWLAMFTLL